jgi:hypothetical protein
MKDKTTEELKDILANCEEKYQKLLKVANKLAEEMDCLSEQYNSAREELINRNETL